MAEARDEAIVHTLTPISTGIAATLKMLTRAIDAKAVVEVGTLMGASGSPSWRGWVPTAS
ncbi:hypothetical protein [Tessaracoccus coleopterorum]|uniref:hypothetical protein n=1 Tax=Tessaracoccus coleopterorum TaxID=2714950 RepID=UPI001E6227D0|nr:hypothetical protein [Tessaracoccus coleopterorum]